jgi:hypothetical protein
MGPAPNAHPLTIAATEANRVTKATRHRVHENNGSPVTIALRDVLPKRALLTRQDLSQIAEDMPSLAVRAGTCCTHPATSLIQYT